MRDGRLILNDHRRTTSARVVGCERREVDPKRPPPYNVGPKRSARVVGCERREVDPKRPPPYNKCEGGGV